MEKTREKADEVRASQTVTAEQKELQDRAACDCPPPHKAGTRISHQRALVSLLRAAAGSAQPRKMRVMSLWLRRCQGSGPRTCWVGRRWPRERGEVRRARSNSFEVGVERRVLCSRAVGCV